MRWCNTFTAQLADFFTRHMASGAFKLKGGHNKSSVNSATNIIKPYLGADVNFQAWKVVYHYQTRGVSIASGRTECISFQGDN
jgi:hypothetical protein